MAKGSSKKRTPTRKKTGWGGAMGRGTMPFSPYNANGMKNRNTKGGTPPTARPARPATDYKKKYKESQRSVRDANKKYNDVNTKYNQRMAQDKADPNRNLQASIVRGNESNTRSITSFNSMAENAANAFNNQTSGLTRNNINEGRGSTARHQNELARNESERYAGSSREANLKNQGMTNAYNDYTNQNNRTTDKYNSDRNSARQGYDDRSRALLDNMGKADQDIHTRNRGQAYAGLDSGFGDASDSLQASLARRGMANSGVGAKALTDLSQDRMRAGATAGVNAYNSAVDMSDNRRGQRLQGETQLYGAETNNLDSLYGANMGNNTTNYGARTNTINDRFNTNMGNIDSRFANMNNLSSSNFNTSQAQTNSDYQKNMAMAGQNYGNSMAVRGQALQNALNNNQQRIANNMGYQQLGKGMAGMSQNYLQQAGSGYTNIAGQAGQTAIGIGGLNNSYNATMQQAQAKKDAKGGDLLGGAMGLAGKALTFSDIRLKRNLKKVGGFNELDIYTWDWTEDAKLIVGDTPAIGFIAQHVQDVYPDYVSVNEETGYLQIAYDKIIGGLSWDSLIA